MEGNNQMTPEQTLTEKKAHYVHLIGNAQIKFEDVIVDKKNKKKEKRFTLHFCNNKGEIMKKVKPLVFAQGNESVKFLSMHLIAEIWDEQLPDHIANFKEGGPHLVTFVESEESNRFGLAPLAASMTSTDPPQNQLQR